jgi:general secretion pathway protein J
MAYSPYSCCKSKQLQRAFTLLELLVAMAIFAILASLAYSGLLTVMEMQQRTEISLQQLARLQTAVSWIQRDIEQLIPRGIRNEFGEAQPVLQFRNTTPIRLEFTHAGWRNPAQQARSQLQRVAYTVEQDSLWRYSWRVLDRAQDSRADKIALLDDIKTVEWRVLDEQFQWLNEYPPSNAVVTPPPLGAVNVTPQFRAIEITLTSKKWGKITRLFQVAGT